MLTLYANDRHANCDGYTRRALLQVGTLGIGGLTLSNLLSAESQAASGGALIKDKAVVVLNLQGGASHIETFDPKMTAPSEYRAMFGEVKTALPGITFGSHFPGLASMADRMAIVRCFQHGISNHEQAARHVMAGGNPSGINLASLFARIAGTNSRRTGIPHASIITPPAVGDEYQGIGRRFVEFVSDTGPLSNAYKPFDPSSGAEIVQNMKLRMPARQLEDRRTLLDNLDTFKRRVDGTDLLGGADRFEQQAFDVLVGGMSDAFDLSREDPALVARYDTSRFRLPRQLQKKRRAASPDSLGKQMLLARRLIEADCRFVTVASVGWDMHGNQNNVSITNGMPVLGPALDKAVTAFLQDLEERGLSEKVLLVITGEFGRTPQISDTGGRGHWGDLCTLAFIGGGLPMGQIIGGSDRLASVPKGDVVTTENMAATIMNTLLDLGELRITSGIPSDIASYLNTIRPIPQLIS
jgi:uncharacterized protein (DUF1501 family)